MFYSLKVSLVCAYQFQFMANISLLVVSLLVVLLVCYFALAGLENEFTFELALLLLGQLTQLVDYLRVILQATSANDVSCFAISLGFGHLIMLLTHVHVSSSVGCILFTAIVEAWKLLFEFSSTSSLMLLPGSFSSFHMCVEILNNVVVVKHVLSFNHGVVVALLGAI